MSSSSSSSIGQIESIEALAKIFVRIIKEHEERIRVLESEVKSLRK